jgi:prepilin-type N-terminal cleavage/methylation domain-containing protein
MQACCARHRHRAFTLAEMLVSVAILTLIVLLVTRLINSAATITTIGNKHMNTDNQARPVLDRMAEDFAQMLKRSDVDFYGKGTAAPNSVGGTMSGGNDQIAFYSQVPGYYPSTGSQSPISLVSYRINSTSNKLERMGKGLVWNGVSATDTPIVFLPKKITDYWPFVANSSASDSADPTKSSYEVIGPQVFRFEYYYEVQDSNQSGTTTTQSIGGTLSNIPWITSPTFPTDHTSVGVNGLADVRAIVVTIAAIDPKSRILVTDQQLQNLATQMEDSPAAAGMQAQWQSAVNAAAIPKAAAAGIHIYQRSFTINGVAQ